MASVDRSNGRWRTPEGESRSQTFDRKLAAEEHLAAMEHSRHDGRYVDPGRGRVVFGEWWADWLTTSALELWPSTIARNESYGRSMILPAFAGSQLGRIDHEAVQRWVGEL